MYTNSISQADQTFRYSSGGSIHVSEPGPEFDLQRVQAAEQEQLSQYVDHLRQKYGPHFRIESVPRDPDVLEKLGKAMSGDDVIIAPNIVAEMAADPKTAAYYERTIDHCFETVPQDKAYFAARGLTFEPCGVVVHEDGTVTYICGGGDTPEKAARIHAENAARDARRAEARREYFAVSRARAQKARLLADQAYELRAQQALLHTTLGNGLQPTPLPDLS